MFTYLTLLFYTASVSAHIFQENTTTSASSSLPSNSTSASSTAPGPSNSTVASTTMVAATTPSSSASVAQYRQCGGTTYTGPTACASPFMCVKFSDYYSECL
ncbi:hypothetical protein IW261DRAFT_615678 [Armillaria novae-zelandiae]|uniref:CBM1 domain-containing protein n=1 Tax=Armillaria novae-zelandiae TaxID=153914 RepID=A0AA39PNR7_9AGAR|nr:hypothetical protein IW261DRAFT_615678 [Armillaria novae-zelandiae]